ncbi:TerC family protein [Phenylobacterium sp.]|jgi:YjbE family integral membrane protein|uniref:TerC family protein n=1 Tax=Phenylobacterium sp. TaxID=1871053 RepID=UPI000C96F1CA|nr:TerC family protein [Phenylobacterium sp.]MAK82342.1 tellurium resistance protein TerC [Phenylobacterium sp.]|tara:strand:- start:3271 stop:3999 length:729 start_codon:yes stop_codon:yes gene_type:complete
MFESLLAEHGPALTALFQVLLIDLVLAGDNAVAVGLAAGALPADQRKKAILYGLIAAVIMRIGFALITTQLLGIIGLLFAGGLLLMWVCWKMWKELREQAVHDEADAEAVLDGDPTTEPSARPVKSFRAAFVQILIADLSMSLDNVLAVAGAAREHPGILVFGLILSIALMGVAATYIASLLHRYRWIGYIGLAVVLYVALSMVWEGHRNAVVKLDRTDSYNAVMPGFLDISPDEAAEHRLH